MSSPQEGDDEIMMDDDLDIDEIVDMDDEPSPVPSNGARNGTGSSILETMDETLQHERNRMMGNVSGGVTATSTNSNDPVAVKRRAIQEIMSSPHLSDLEKRLRIQGLMDGRPVPSPPASTSGVMDQGRANANGNNNNANEINHGMGVQQQVSPQQQHLYGQPYNHSENYHEQQPNVSGMLGANPHPIVTPGSNDTMTCVHYERKCFIVAPCCNKVFGCRVCHDEMTPAPGHGPMDRFAIREIVCKVCLTRQPSKTNKCINPNCQVVFAEYHCNICNLWMSHSKKPFHCADCGFCRVGGREAYTHCHECCMCISTAVIGTHNCMKDKYKNNCPVCREDMFSSRQSPQDLPCGHAIHAHCFRKLAGFDYRCPICKKTVVSQASMAAAWAARARDIELQPMPADLARVVNIMCNDCENKSEGRNWHFLGVQCPGCDSFNTVVEQVISSGTGGGQPDAAATS
mmetsp:Transcript_24270/g.35468  ORF Transcript_24270/g.35468 Transcript_24270/m.35468 type:complete len:459 (+) Transcript_24270:95-1471(+)|eukprot:CAMPEP_0195513976 /NCGR_PEP_ID=MMETSP0794_2-20130614/5511_1 /TAXON_ID=515487 /ORGANISM="Stephanopyxis turris, Strain CCMP 815" /LENGTH=458 /DNA_ID=CAMNT_0040642125 /DNA_START=76 /DNA_END=1455 /DNA_ORIENTATION=-